MGNAKVLFLDDDEDMLINYVAFLEDESYEVLATTDAEKAKWYLNEDDIGVFITDYEMPEINGLEILEFAREASPATIRMMATGHTESDIMVAAINEGNVYRYFVKPIDPDDLITGIKEGAEYYEELKTVEHWIGKHKNYSDASSDMEILQTQLDERDAELQMILAENEELSSKQRDTNKAVLSALVLLIQTKDNSLHKNGEWVAKFGMAIGKSMGLSKQELSLIQMGSYLKNLGLILLPDMIIEKKMGMFTKEEMNLYLRFPLLGQQMLKRFPGFAKIGANVAHILERFDGSGPFQIAGDDIPVIAQVISMAEDAYRIMHSSTGQIGKKMQYGKTYMINHIRKNMNKLYSPLVARKTIQLLGGKENIEY